MNDNRNAQEQPGTVYLLWAEGTPRFKIGFTRRCVGKRASAIEGHSPYPVRIIATKAGSVATERGIHFNLRRFRVNREWFQLPEERVWSLLRDTFGVKG